MDMLLRYMLGFCAMVLILGAMLGVLVLHDVTGIFVGIGVAAVILALITRG